MLKIKTAFFIVFLSLHALAQKETIISGRVTEQGTNSGIPFVNIFFKGTVIGSVTDFDGNYFIKTLTPKDSIYISIIGYKSKSKNVKVGAIQNINFQLSPEALNLSTIEIRPGINPALRIIKKAQENKNIFNRNNLNSVQYLSYTKQEADVDNVTPKMRKWKLFSGFTNMWDSLDVIAGEDSKANLPVMMSEVVSELYRYKEENKFKENVNAVKIKFVGMKDGSAVSQLTGTDFQSYNFCEDNILIQGKEVLNPIATNAFLFYKYYLVDSVLIDQFKCYKIDCIPKNPKDLVFTGSIWITDSSYCIKQLDLEITPDVNFNWLDKARIQQVNIPTEAGPWVPILTRATIDFSTLSKHFVSMVEKTFNANKYFVVNKPKEKSFYGTRIQYDEDALIKDSLWWHKNRTEPLNLLEKKSYDMIDTVRSIPFIKNGVNVLYFLFSGYKDIGPVDVGHYMNLYSYNSYEGNRFKLGFRTNAKFSKNWIIRGYGAYGTKDKDFKYSLQLERIISRFPWSILGAQYRDDIEQIGLNFSGNNNLNLGESPNSLFNSFSQIGNISKLVRKQEARIWFEKSFNIGLNAKVQFQNVRTQPLFPVTFGDQFTIFQQKNFTISEVMFELRYSAKERYVQNGNERISFGNKKSPTITLNFTQGLKNFVGGDFNYSKASVTLSNRINMATLGYSRIKFTAGKVFSKIPFTLLQIPRGNQTNFYSNTNFNQMQLFEFVSDQYLEAFWQHHFNGFFFNRVPLIKKMNLREVIGLNMTYGKLSKMNASFNSNNFFTVMDDIPYFESSIGIENIFSILRVDFLYRLTYNDDFYLRDYNLANPGHKITNWGIKTSLQFSF